MSHLQNSVIFLLDEFPLSAPETLHYTLTRTILPAPFQVCTHLSSGHLCLVNQFFVTCTHNYAVPVVYTQYSSRTDNGCNFTSSEFVSFLHHNCSLYCFILCLLPLIVPASRPTHACGSGNGCHGDHSLFCFHSDLYCYGLLAHNNTKNCRVCFYNGGAIANCGTTVDVIIYSQRIMFHLFSKIE